MARHDLAQVNLGRLVAPIADPAVAEFHAALEPINALADASPGFRWRLQTEEGDATAVEVEAGDPLLIVNMSTWRSPADLRAFVYGAEHKAYLVRRPEWFQAFGAVYVALWWVPEGAEPTVTDAQERLAHLIGHGPTPHAFTLRQEFPPPTD